jgi:hypothetical protein
VRFDVRTNWFRLVPDHVRSVLTHKGEIGVTMEYTVEWSREVQAIENSVMACVKDEHLYRPGEVERMVKRAQQISRQLPLNTLYSQVPYENTLGGFEMFASGVADLAPELVGFYGAPGVDPERETTLFLVGDNFSVHGTRVIAGNQPVDSKLLSREVAQVRIPRHVRIDRRLCQPRTQHATCCNLDCTDLYVEVRLATPYGVSSPLYVPVVQQDGWKAENHNPAVCCPSVTLDCKADGTEPTPPPETPAGTLPEAPPPAAVPEAPSEREAPILPMSYQVEQPAAPRPPELHWDRTRYTMTYQLREQNQAVTGKLTDVRAAPPHELVIWSPADRALADAKADVRVVIVEAPPLPVDPGTIVLEGADLTVTDGTIHIRGAEFKSLHENLLKAVIGGLQNRAQATWPPVVRVKLQARVAGAKTPSTAVVELLEVPIKLPRSTLSE